MEFHACPRSHAQELRAAPGSMLCVPCTRQVESSLRALPGLYQECLHHILPIPGHVGRTKVSGSRRKDHLNPAALDTRHDIIAVLESWSGFVAQELGVVVPPRSVPHLTHFLVHHLEWLTAQPPAADFADEIDDLKADLLRTVDPGPADPHSMVTQCVVDNCTGTIVTSPQHTGNTGRSSISCSSGHTWKVHEWIVLRDLMERQRKGMSA